MIPTPEGSLPTVWTEISYTDQSSSSPDIDFGNLDSAAFAKWTWWTRRALRVHLAPAATPTTWLPIVYLINGPAVIKDANNMVDAVATCTTTYMTEAEIAALAGPSASGIPAPVPAAVSAVEPITGSSAFYRLFKL
jgi:hypothetical protein